MDDADTWQYYFKSVDQTKLLLAHPDQFIITSFIDPVNTHYNNFFSSDNSFWNALKDILIVKAEALLNLFSFSHYYINVIFYAFLTFFGNIAFVRAYRLLFPQANKYCLVIPAFLIPSTLFWTSGFHKDGVLFMLICFIIYQLALWLAGEKCWRKSFTLVGICLFFILFIRSYVALTLIPALMACVLSSKFPKHAAKWNVGILLLGILTFFGSSFLPSSLDLTEWVVNRRMEFYSLSANSKLSANNLENSLQSYLQNLPEALNHGFLRPYLWENLGIFYIPFALELIILFIFLLYFLFNRYSLTALQRSFLLFGVLFCFSNWLFLGYMVHIVGALVRYKSIFTPFLIAPLLLSMRCGRLIKN